MNTKVVPLNASTKFLMDRTTKNLIDFLKDGTISSNEDSNLVTQLLNDINKPMLMDHKNLFEFDKELWSVLSQLNIVVPWLQFKDEPQALKVTPHLGLNLVNDGDNKNTNIQSEALEQSTISPATLELITEAVLHDELERAARNSQSDHILKFFYEINEYVCELDLFKKNIEYSKEISKLLVDLAIQKKSLHPLEKGRLNASSWDWLFPTLCSAYAAFTIKTASEIPVHNGGADENLVFEKNKNINIEKEGAAYEAVGLYSILMLSLLALNGVNELQKVTRSIFLYLKKCHFINDEDPTIGMILNVCDTTPGSSSKVTLESLDTYVTIFSLFMSIHDATRFIRPDAYATFVHAYLDEQWEVAESKLEHIMYQPVHSILSAYLYAKSDEVSQSKNIFSLFKTFDRDDIIRLIVKRTATGPDYRFSQYILKNLNNDYWSSEDQYFHEVNSLAIDYVRRLNEKFIQTGFPEHSNLAGSIDDLEYIRVFPSHYDCISTLAIPLSSSEFGQDNFHGTSPTERYVAGARTLAESGYTKHALVFLSYGLMRICLRIASLDGNTFSVKQVHEFISLPKIEKHLEQFFIPSMRFVFNNCLDLPHATKIWITALLEKFNEDGIDASSYIINREKLAPVLFNVPIWFSNEGESLINSIHEYKNATDKYTGKDWTRFYLSKDLRSKLRNISESLESVVIELFRPYINLCKTNSSIKLSLAGLSDTSEMRFDSITLGWIERFLRRIIKAIKDDPKASAIFLKAVQKENYLMGKAIYRMQQLNIATVDSFNNYRVIDNSLSHRESGVGNAGVLNKSQSDWLISYAVSDFAEISDLFI
jgi:hypothetical protein